MIPTMYVCVFNFIQLYFLRQSLSLNLKLINVTRLAGWRVYSPGVYMDAGDFNSDPQA